MPSGTPNTIADFYDSIPFRPKHGCWEWSGRKCACGYGAFSLRGKEWKSHRLSWQHVNGSIPDGMCVCHKCDNPSCVNPEHLFLGTHADNMSDMSDKGRRVNPKGEANGGAKITARDVAAIRSDDRGHREIAVEYGISRSMVGRIKRLEKWAHL